MAYKKRTDKKRNTLQKGEFVRKSDGRYCYQYKEPVTDKFHTVYANTLKELRQKEKDLQKSFEIGIDIQKAKILTVNELFYIGLELKEREKVIKPATRVNYEGLWHANCFEFGKAKAAEVSIFQIRALMADFVSAGLSKATIKLLHGLLSQVFDDAVSQHIRIDNPCQDKTVKRTRAKGTAQKQREALTPGEQAELLMYVNGDNIYNVYADMLTIALYTGLRVGELTGLTWDDIDIKGGKINVKRQLKYGKTARSGETHFYITTPKTAAGIRTVYFGSEVREAFKHLKQINFLLGKTQKAAEVDGISNFVFLNKNGTPYAANAFNFILRNIVESHNKKCKGIPLPHISAHILRHSYAARAVENGVDYKALQESLGHTTIGVTMDVYAKPNDDEWKKKEILKICKAN